MKMIYNFCGRTGMDDDLTPDVDDELDIDDIFDIDEEENEDETVTENEGNLKKITQWKMIQKTRRRKNRRKYTK